MKIAVIDYQSGNLSSVVRALQSVAPSADIYLADNAFDINRADRLVLPGQGAIPQAMRAIDDSGLTPILQSCFGVKPLLGICVGMQILFEKSEEVNASMSAQTNKVRAETNQEPPTMPSLGLIRGRVNRFRHLPADHKIPHMGWSEVRQSPHPLWQNIAEDARFYFAHSYYCAPVDPTMAVGHTHYGIAYASAIALPKVFAVQFHPEKSGRDGLQLLKNFAQNDGNW